MKNLTDFRRKLLFIALTAFVAGVMFAGGCLLVNDLSPGNRRLGFGIDHRQRHRTPTRYRN
ncbi:hypothetical protein [Desulfoscipio geothermicus]|uniref:Uncharacterized protein n=1 Tax=Desulfoscipio geothermicus DSM 3669 TaxID=1121426 RepID=A0A1I6D1S9_9FIRM|nr:hypothetical protein SAMN05660706_104104 [Desulfoscipio geothermicus DSM 3669]